jgi:DNA-binding NarL/FixJ family response regulator
LISLLAAGLNDKAIAYELGISASTLTRRITEIMHRLDAETRFQLGWLAARHEFMAGHSPPAGDVNAS